MKRLFLLCLAACCLFIGLLTQPAIAQDLSAIESLSFNQMPPFEEAGSWPSVGDVAEEIGYDTARSWSAGEYPVDVLKIGDILEALHPEAFALSDLAVLETFTIADIPLIANLSLLSLLQSIPFLEDWPVESLTGVGDILINTFGLEITPTDTLGQVLSAYPAFAEVAAGKAFGALPLTTLPNIETAKLSDFPGFQQQALSDIPGLGDVALGAFPQPLALLSVTAKQDIVFSNQEYSGEKPTPKSVSGTVKEGFNVPCVGGCAHIELSGPGWQGDQWMTKDHRIPDGSGLLGELIGEAGAYRLPFGESFALQVRSTNEKEGSAEWGIAFRVCQRRLFVDLGCTAYAFEVPLGITTYEKDTVLTGLKDLRGGVTEPVEAPPGWEDLRPETPPELRDVIARNSGNNRNSSGTLCGKGEGGVDYEALAKAFAQIEGDYSSVGQPTSGGLGGNGQELYGVGLGRYQYMSYREDVRAAILPQPGGANLLAKADIGAVGQISPEDVLRTFPPSIQDRLFRGEIERLVKLAISEGAIGDDIIRRVGQMHYSGEAGEVDGSGKDIHGRLSIKAYGEELLKNYKAALEGSDSECGKAVGQFIYPVDGPSVETSFFGYRWHPISRQNKFHGGLDIGADKGTPVVASDGGTVIVASPEGSSGGYGNFVQVDHGNGFVTSYAHLHSMNVSAGNQVNQGDLLGGVGTTGSSTGDHLHFEIENNGRLEDPKKYV